MKRNPDKDNRDAYSPDIAPVTTESAFKSSDGHNLNGLTLQPYTPERIWAADAMSLKYGNLSKAAVKQWLETGIYPGMASDVGIVIWLCSLEDIEDVKSARRDPSSAEQLACDFAVEHGIVSLKQKKFWEARKVFLAIMDEMHVVYGEPEKKTEKKKTPSP